MRTNKELLKVLLANIDKLKHGLCLLAIELKHTDIITTDEHFKISDYIYKNRPKKTSKLYDPEWTRLAWYWPIGAKTPRVRWLKYHIRICKS
jgi:hypothetical protein